jgi:hypothetical protein
MDRSEAELELPVINPETGFPIGITIGRTEIPDSEAVSEWTPVKASQVARSGDLQSSPIKAGADVPEIVVGGVEEEETFALVRYDDVDGPSQPTRQVPSGSRNAAGEEATIEPKFPEMVIRSSQSGPDALEGTAERAMQALRESNVVPGDLGAAVQSATLGKSTSRTVRAPRAEIPDSDDEEESFENSRNDLIAEKEFEEPDTPDAHEPETPDVHGPETPDVYGDESTVSDSLQPREEDVVMTEGLGDIAQPGQGKQEQPTALTGDETTQEPTYSQSSGWLRESFQIGVPQKQWLIDRRGADNTAGDGSTPIDDDETASRHSDSLRTLDTQLPGSHQMAKRYVFDKTKTEVKDSQSFSSTDEELSNRVIELSQGVPDTQLMRTSVQHAPEAPGAIDTSGQEAGHSKSPHPPDVSAPPQMTKRYDIAGKTEIKDSQSSSFTNSESSHSVEDSSQDVPDTQPMRSVPLASVTNAQKRPAPVDDEEPDTDLPETQGKRYDFKKARRGNTFSLPVSLTKNHHIVPSSLLQAYFCGRRILESNTPSHLWMRKFFPTPLLLQIVSKSQAPWPIFPHLLLHQML